MDGATVVAVDEALEVAVACLAATARDSVVLGLTSGGSTLGLDAAVLSIARLVCTAHRQGPAAYEWF